VQGDPCRSAPSTAPRIRSCSCNALSARAPRGRTTVVERCRDHIGQAIRVASPGWCGASPSVPDRTRGQSRSICGARAVRPLPDAVLRAFRERLALLVQRCGSRHTEPVGTSRRLTCTSESCRRQLTRPHPRTARVRAADSALATRSRVALRVAAHARRCTEDGLVSRPWATTPAGTSIRRIFAATVEEHLRIGFDRPSRSGGSSPSRRAAGNHANHGLHRRANAPADLIGCRRDLCGAGALRLGVADAEPDELTRRSGAAKPPKTTRRCLGSIRRRALSSVGTQLDGRNGARASAR
jgi:hypothetical protein